MCQSLDAEGVAEHLVKVISQREKQFELSAIEVDYEDVSFIKRLSPL